MIWTVSKYCVWMTQKPRKGDFGELKCQKFAGEPCPQTSRGSRKSVSINSWSAYDSIHFATESFLLGYFFIYLELIERPNRKRMSEQVAKHREAEESRKPSSPFVLAAPFVYRSRLSRVPLACGFLRIVKMSWETNLSVVICICAMRLQLFSFLCYLKRRFKTFPFFLFVLSS